MNGRLKVPLFVIDFGEHAAFLEKRLPCRARSSPFAEEEVEAGVSGIKQVPKATVKLAGHSTAVLERCQCASLPAHALSLE